MSGAARRKPGRRPTAFAGVAAVVALLHAGLLHGVIAFAAPLPTPAAGMAAPRHAVMVRLLTPPSPLPPEEPPVAEEAVPAAPPAAVVPAKRVVAHRTPRRIAPVAAPEPPPVLVTALIGNDAASDESATAGADAPVVWTVAAAPAPAATSVGADPPVYRTKLPPAITMPYVLRRGILSGTGEMTWQPQDGRYELKLEGRVAGIRLLALESRGTLDAAGIAPVRYVDERRGRGAQAANFQRLPGGGGKITYSGPSDEVPLPRGAQDRVTWLVQLAAVAAADPARVGPGGQVSMFVSGARADADVWTFAHVGAETLTVEGRPTPTVHLLREPRYPHDTRVDVWLDPARHYLPVRARMSNGSGSDAGEAFELSLRE